MALPTGHRLSPSWPHTPTKTAASIAPPFSHLTDHTIAFSGQWDGLGFHGDRTNKETSCQECFSFCPRSSCLKLQPPPPGLRAVYSSTSALSGFRHHVRHANLLYLHVCGGECVRMCVSVWQASVKAIMSWPLVLIFQAGGGGSCCVTLTGAEMICRLTEE